MAPGACAPGAVVVGAPLSNVVALAARTLERTIVPPQRSEVRLALFGVEEFLHMGKHRLHATRRCSAMPVLSHVHELFNAEQCQAYLRTLRWHDRPLQCPRCQSHHIGQWGPYL